MPSLPQVQAIVQWGAGISSHCAFTATGGVRQCRIVDVHTKAACPRTRPRYIPVVCAIMQAATTPCRACFLVFLEKSHYAQLCWKTKPICPAACLQVYCIMNTVVALLGACLAAFAASAAVGGRLDMVHVQNATLAGGVAIGSSANLEMLPAVALAGEFLPPAAATCLVEGPGGAAHGQRDACKASSCAQLPCYFCLLQLALCTVSSTASHLVRM